MEDYMSDALAEIEEARLWAKDHVRLHRERYDNEQAWSAITDRLAENHVIHKWSADERMLRCRMVLDEVDRALLKAQERHGILGRVTIVNWFRECRSIVAELRLLYGDRK